MLIAFLFLCAAVGICVGLAFNWYIIPSLLSGLVIGSLPFWVPRIRPRLQAERIIEISSLSLLIIIAIGVCVRALLPILADQSIQIEAVIPLLFLVPPLYLTYIILNYMAADKGASSVSSHLSAIFSGPPIILTVAMGITLATYALIFIHYIQLHYPNWAWFADKFLERGSIPPITLMLFFWGIILFINKIWMLKREQNLLTHSETKPTSTLERARQTAVTSGLDKATATEYFLETLWKKSQDSYNIPRYINWAIPILGFIGTVLGISLAADGIQNIISSQSGLSQFSEELGQAIAPLGIAFDTTLIALSLSVFLMLIQTMLQRWEDNLLIDYENTMRNSG